MIAVGLDVHKDTIFCGVHNGKSLSAVSEHSTLTCDIRDMALLLKDLGATHIAMESTGIYWIPIWNILESFGCFELMLVNPFQIKQMPGRKSDVKDAQWIATLLQKGLLRPSLVPNSTIRELRCYSRKYMKLQGRQTSILQEMERTLEMCSIRITSFVSNISGKSVLRVVESIINGEYDVDALERLIHGRIKNKHQENITKSLDGFITKHHRFTLSLVYEEYQLLLSQSEQCEQKMSALCAEHYSQELALLKTMPGVSDLSAMILIAETGADMSAFETSSKFAGWTGLRPRNDESAGKYKSTATTKGNKYLRAILVQVAWAASRTKGGYFKEKFQRLLIRKPRKKALVAIARKLCVVMWNILHDKKGYNPDMMPIVTSEKLLQRMNYHQKELDRLAVMANG